MIKENTAQLASIARKIGIQNTDVRYYRDKYLGVLAICCVLIGAAFLTSRWPPTHTDLLKALEFSGLAAVVLVFSSQRLAMLGACIAFLGARILVGIVFYGSSVVLGSALAAGCGVMVMGILFFFRRRSLRLPYTIGAYSYAEAGIDVLVFCGVLYLIVRFLA
jgi:hypothetical protein